MATIVAKWITNIQLTTYYLLDAFFFHKVSRQKKNLKSFSTFEVSNVREKIRTPDTLVRSQVLYPAELHVHTSSKYYIFEACKCWRPESNRYGRLVPQDFKSCASACSATPAYKDNFTFLIMGPIGLEPMTLCL